MRMGARDLRFTRPALVIVVCGLAGVAGAEEKGTPQGLRFFEQKIRPVLVRQCYQCHSARAATSGKLKGKLRLDTRAGTRAGGESGPSVVPGKPGDSLLIGALRHESFKMPPKGKLPAGVIADFVTWIKDWDQHESAPYTVQGRQQ